MPNNKPTRKHWAIDYLVGTIVAGMSSFWGGILAFFLKLIFNRLAREGIYFIDVKSAQIRTNMHEKTWLRIVRDSYEKVGTGQLTESEGAKLDHKTIEAFDDFVTFKRIKL